MDAQTQLKQFLEASSSTQTPPAQELGESRPLQAFVPGMCRVTEPTFTGSKHKVLLT